MDAKTRVVKEPIEIGKVLVNAVRLAVKYAPVLLILGLFSWMAEIVFPGLNRVVYQQYLKEHGMTGKLLSMTVKSLITAVMWVIGSAIAYTFIHKTEIEKEAYAPALLHSLGIVASRKFFRYVLNVIRYSATILIGALAFIVPGLIWTYKYKFAAMIALLEPDGVDASRPFEESARITDRYKADLFMVSFFLWCVNFINIWANDSGMLYRFPLTGLVNMLLMPAIITVNVLLLYILLDKKTVNVETAETGEQTLIVKTGGDGSGYTGIILAVIFIFLGVRVGIYYIRPVRSIGLPGHIDLTANSDWRMEEDKFIPGDYVLTVPEMKAGKKLVVRNVNKSSLNIQGDEINDAVRAVLDPYSLDLERTADMGFTGADTPGQRGEIDVNGKKWAVCEYRIQDKNRARVWKTYYTFMGESVPLVSYSYLYMPKNNAARAEAAAKKDEETVKQVLGRFSVK